MIVFDFVKCFDEGGLWVLPHKNLGLNGVKLRNSRHHQHGIALSKMPGMLNRFFVMICKKEVKRKDDQSPVHIFRAWK